MSYAYNDLKQVRMKHDTVYYPEQQDDNIPYKPENLTGIPYDPEEPYVTTSTPYDPEKPRVTTSTPYDPEQLYSINKPYESENYDKHNEMSSTLQSDANESEYIPEFDQAMLNVNIAYSSSQTQ